jgi:hypothetical protein
MNTKISIDIETNTDTNTGTDTTTDTAPETGMDGGMDTDANRHRNSMDMPTCLLPEAALSVVFENIEPMKRLFALKKVCFSEEATLSLLNVNRKRSSDNVTSDIESVRSSDNVGSSDHKQKGALSDSVHHWFLV